MVEACDTYSSSKSEKNNPLARKLNKILDTRLENDKDTLDALKALSTFFTENTLRGRRNLRGDIEKRSLVINEAFVQVLRDVKEGLDCIYNDVQGMNNCCKNMMDQLKMTKLQTCDLIGQTTKLQEESQKLQLKQDVVQNFLSAFQLKQEEIEILRGRKDGGLDENFFSVLTKVKKIHSDCKVLLRSNQQNAGIEIMESMAFNQEAAYEYLFRWTQNECRLFTSEFIELNPLLCRSMETLQDRPILFKYSLDEYSSARRATVVRSFIDALTRGGPGGMPRPIELLSHDPLRYVGDMLAWLHQTTASEKELLESLLKTCSNLSLEDEIRQVLSYITEGLCRPLKVRIEQVILSEPGSVTLYKLASLLRFYHNTIKNVVSQEALLLLVLEELRVLSQKMFFNSLSCHCNQILEKVDMPPLNLSCPESLTLTLTLLKEVLSCQDACLVLVDDRQKDVPQILSIVVDPMLQMCHVSASRLSPGDMAAYLLNCIYLIHSTLSIFEFTDQKLEMLQAQMDAHVDTLVSEQASYIVGNLNLGSVYEVLQDYQPKMGPLSKITGCDALTVQSGVKKIDAFLASPDSMTISQSGLLLSSSLRQLLRKRSMELICRVYSQVHEAINDPSNEYPDPSSVLPRSPDQMKTLLL